MEVSSLWNDQIPEKDGQKLSVNDVAFSPDGTKTIVAVGNRVLLYRSSDGDLLDSLRGHKDVVYSVSFSSDGSRFASGGADNMVIIWKNTGQGLLKYSHSASIQRVRFNPSTLLLASCSEVDFGLWTPEQKQVTKEKVASRILCAAWSTDGSLLALGMLSGLVSLRTQQGEEVLRFERKAPIWTLSFIPESSSSSSSSSATRGIVAAGSTGGVNNNTSNAMLFDRADNLAIGCWDKTYSLYKLTPKSALLHIEKQLSYYPLSMHCVNNPSVKMSYFMVSGSNKQVHVLSREGVKLAEVTRPHASWVWCADTLILSPADQDDLCVYGTHHGAIETVTIDFAAVHSLYKDRYAYRENLTEVIVHHLGTDKKVRIKCKDMIHNLSLFRNKLAVQLLDRVCIYESNLEDSVDIHFRLKKERVLLAGIGRNPEAKEAKIVTNLLATAALSLFSATDNVLEMYSTETALRTKLWTFASKITCLKVDAGLPGREGVVFGLANGEVLRLFCDNPFPVKLCVREKPVSLVAFSLHRSMIATVDSESTLCVSDMGTQEVLYSLKGVRSAAFNTEVEELLAVTLTANNRLAVVSGLRAPSAASSSSSPAPISLSPEVHEQHLIGRVLGFRGQRVWASHRGALTTLDVPQGENILRALDGQDFTAAYRAACLGATEADWRLLAMRALRAQQLNIAKNCFARLKDHRFLTLIERIERESGVSASASVAVPVSASVSTASSGRVRDRGRRGEASAAVNSSISVPSVPVSSILEAKWLAEAMAYEGHFHEAAKILQRAGKSDEAIKLFTTLRRWEDAKTIARNTSASAAMAVDAVAALTAQQAQWLQEVRDWRGAAELFSSMGQHDKAARIVGENEGSPGWEATMLEVVKACPPEDIDTLVFCGTKLSVCEDVSLAREAFTKARDFAKLMALYVKRKLWTEAAKLAEDYAGQFDMAVFKDYAEWLVTQDRYEEAMDAFKKSGRADLARKVLSELTENAVTEKRFKDAGYYFWMLSKDVEQEALSLSKIPDNELAVERLFELQSQYEHQADIYYAYSNIYSFVTDPFTAFAPEMLFQVSRFIINSLGQEESLPGGVSKSFTLYTLAKQAMALGAFKLARTAYERLSRLTIPERKMEEVELDMLLVQAKPVRDAEEVVPVCYRCSTANPLLNPFHPNSRFAQGDVCTNCGHPFVRSFINFDVLPLVEFVPEPSISDEEAMDLIRQQQSSALSQPRRAALERDRERSDSNKGRNVNVLSLHDPDGDQSMFMEDSADLFNNCLTRTLERQKSGYVAVQVDANTLLAMKRSEVFVCRPTSSNKRATFYKNMLPEIPIAISQPCHRFFHLEDFEFAYLSEKKCPYSRQVNVGEYGSV